MDQALAQATRERRLNEKQRYAVEEEKVPAPIAENTGLTKAGPWRRFWARIIDLWVIGFPTGLLIGGVLGYLSLDFGMWIQRPVSQIIFGWLMLPLILIIEMLIFRQFGSTLGKALLGIRVFTDSGRPIGSGQYAKRLLGVYGAGLGTGFPLVNLFTMAYQQDRLRKGKRATYDEGKYSVRASRP